MKKYLDTFARAFIARTPRYVPSGIGHRRRGLPNGQPKLFALDIGRSKRAVTTLAAQNRLESVTVFWV